MRSPARTVSTLASHTVGAGAQRVVLLHGFTHTGTSWEGIARHIVERFVDVRCELVDLPGHGRSNLRPTFVELVDLLVADTRDACLVGYSMGARLAIAVACHRRSALRAMVSVGGTAGIDDPVEREWRRNADRELAARVRSVGTEQFVRDWVTRPTFAGYVPSDDDLRERLTNSPNGLAYALEQLGPGSQPSYWKELAHVTTRSTFVAGGSDTKFVAIAERMSTIVAGSRLHVVPDTGHVTHLEAPGIVSDIIGEALSQ